jgi:FeS assembly SUF system protein
MAPGTEEMLENEPKSGLDDGLDDASPEGSMNPDAIRDQVIAQLKTVFDPEIPVNIYELGLIYKVDVAADGATQVTMTLTTPMCPAAEELPPEVETKARSVPGVTSVQLDLVWEPPWSPDMMSDAAKLDLGMT